MKVAIEDGAVRYAADDDINGPKLQVVSGGPSDVVAVTYILAGTVVEDMLTAPLKEAVTAWEFFQMGLDRHTDSRVEALSCSILTGNLRAEGGKSVKT